MSTIFQKTELSEPALFSPSDTIGIRPYITVENGIKGKKGTPHFCIGGEEYFAILFPFFSITAQTGEYLPA